VIPARTTWVWSFSADWFFIPGRRQAKIVTTGLRRSVARLLGRRRQPSSKADAELSFWQRRKEIEGTLSGPHYEAIFTTHFGLEQRFFAGQRVLDIGCGPRGSLEWADMAAERVGLDPLVDDYRELGIDTHAMDYVAAPAERMPFATGHFDVVSALNSLDHVDDLKATAAEITRVAKPGATLLLIVEVGHEPTPTEPQSLGWNVADLFAGWATIWQKRNAMHEEIYASLWADDPYREGPGLLSARLTRN
jgi:SAM-dependent methyltransferase